MWMSCGCSRIIGLLVAIGCGVLSATRADAGFTSVQPPGVPPSVSSGRSGVDFTPRCDLPELLKLQTDAAPRGHASVLDLPDAWDFQQNHRHDGEDHLVARLNGERRSDKPYSLFWEDQHRGMTDRSVNDLGVDVKSSAPAVVPLPPGVWAGLVLLTGVAWHQVRRHRRQLA
jgi:hypothetical protein